MNEPGSVERMAEVIFLARKSWPRISETTTVMDCDTVLREPDESVLTEPLQEMAARAVPARLKDGTMIMMAYDPKADALAVWFGGILKETKEGIGE